MNHQPRKGDHFMKASSARALIGLATMTLAVGFVILSPSGAFVSFLLAALLSVFPAIFGAGKLRGIAVVLLLISVWLAVGKYPDFKSEQERYRQRANNSKVT